MVICPPGTNISSAGGDLETVAIGMVVAAVTGVPRIGGTDDVWRATPNTAGVGTAAADMHISLDSDIVLDAVAIEPICPPCTDIAPWIVDTHIETITTMSAVIVGAVC